MTGISELERDLRILAADYSARMRATGFAIVSFKTGQEVPESPAWCVRLYLTGRRGLDPVGGKGAHVAKARYQDTAPTFYAHSPIEAIVKASHWVKSGAAGVIDNGMAEAAE